MNIFKVTRDYYADRRTTWHDSKVTADKIVKRHRKLGKMFMRKLDKLSDKYPPEKREVDSTICEDYLMARVGLVYHFAEEHNERDAPMKWVELEKLTVKPSRSSIVSFVRNVDREWQQGV